MTESVPHRHEATVRWSRGGAAFIDQRYSRGHVWSFDGGVDVPGSSSPAVVPLPQSVAAAVDPEEAVVAAASSCHMLCFLALAAKRGFVVDRYEDSAFGTVAQRAFQRITLRPEIRFAGGKTPSPDAIAALHEAAHHECYVANSLRCEVVVEPPV